MGRAPPARYPPCVDPSLQDRLEDASGLAFLCSGNIIRSAFAELWARHLGCPLPVRSGATTYRNARIHPPTARALEERGVDPAWTAGFRPTFVDELLPQLDDRVVLFGMKREHLLALPAHPGIADRSFLLTQARGRTDELADPMFEGGLEEVLDTIADCVGALVARLTDGAPSRAR